MADDNPPAPAPPTKPRKKRGPYKPKNHLDGFLKFVYRGKYKHIRYEKYTDFIIRGKGHTPEQAAEIIARQKTEGIGLHIHQLLCDEIGRFETILKKEHARNANKVKRDNFYRRTEGKLTQKTEKIQNCENCQRVNEKCSSALQTLPFSMRKMQSSKLNMPFRIRNYL